MTKAEVIKIIADLKPEIRRNYKVDKIAIFGSYSREEQNINSDIDILVDFKEPVGFEFIELGDYLEKILNTKVDLVTKNAIKPNRWEYINKDLTYV